MLDILHTLLRPRWLNLLAVLGCIFTMIAVLWFQHVDGLEPCPLCIFQRVALMASGLFFLLAGLHNPDKLGRRIYAVLCAIPAITGAAIAIRHLWLQSLPEDQIPDCGPGLDYLVDVFPMQEVVSMVLSGSGECAEVDWTFLGLSMPGWALVVFVGLTLIALFQLFRPEPRQTPLSSTQDPSPDA